MFLYHFTSILHIPKIFESGELKKGDIPLRKSSAYGEDGHGVWLTTENNVSGKQHGLAGLVDKTKVRFKIEVQESHPQLFTWVDYAKLNNVSPEWFKALDKAGGGMSHTWWLYIGEIDINSSQVTIAIKEADSYVAKPLVDILEISHTLILEMEFGLQTKGTHP